MPSVAIAPISTARVEAAPLVQPLSLQPNTDPVRDAIDAPSDDSSNASAAATMIADVLRDNGRTTTTIKEIASIAETAASRGNPMRGTNHPGAALGMWR